MPYEKELSIAISAVESAVRLCRGVQQNLIATDTVVKNDRSPVTIADLGTQAVVFQALHRAFPSDALIGEEDSSQLQENAELREKIFQLVQAQLPGMSDGGLLEAIDLGAGEADYRGRYWTLDPIDGTKGFLRGDQYAIALGLVERGEVVLGVLGCPNYPLDPAEPEQRGAIFYAVKNAGAYQVNLQDGLRKKIAVDGISDGAAARFCESVEAAHADHDTHAGISAEIGITRPPYRIDSQCKYAAVARGDASLYLRLPRNAGYREKIWDHAAGVIIVQEAGGRVSDFRGNPLNFSLGRKLSENVGILASNGVLHDRALRAIAKIQQQPEG